MKKLDYDFETHHEMYLEKQQEKIKKAKEKEIEKQKKIAKDKELREKAKLEKEKSNQ